MICSAVTPLVERLGRRAPSIEQSVWGRTDTYDSIYRVIEEMEALPGRRVLLFMLENRPDWQVIGTNVGAMPKRPAHAKISPAWPRYARRP